MANNLAIQFGTALPKNTVFSALRQDLVRRMLNCSTDLSWADRLKVIEDYIQLLVNSGHSFRFIKAVILQGLTRYKFMLNRADYQWITLSLCLYIEKEGSRELVDVL